MKFWISVALAAFLSLVLTPAGSLILLILALLTMWACSINPAAKRQQPGAPDPSAAAKSPEDDSFSEEHF